MRVRLRALAVLATLGMLAAACSSTTSPTTTPGPSAGASVGEHDILPPQATGSPVTGGTLNIVGSGDVDKLDTCCAYYTTTYEILRAVSRQLVSYQSTHSDPNPATPVPDLATYSVSSDGLTYTFKIKKGVMWDTPNGPRQITSADEVLGIKRLCNPVNPAPPISYWENNIAGMPAYCKAFAALKLSSDQATEIGQLKSFMTTNNISGITTPDSSTVVFKLQHPSSSFINIMAMPMSSPVPPEILDYLPGSVQEEQHFISDGPYTITSYTPNVSYHLVDNPAWSQSTDSLRHQYFKAINVTMGQSDTTVQQQLATGDADLEWDTLVPAAQVQSLINAKDQHLVIAFIGGITYLVFNMHSPALTLGVRKALQYCADKQHLVQVSGGPSVNVPAPQILPPQITGYQKIDPYPTTNNAGDPAKCRSMLAQAGAAHLSLRLVYANNPPNPAQATALQSDFAKAGVTLKLVEEPTQGAYYNYVETSSNLKNWDLAFGGWFPDWQGNAAQTYFSPLLDGRLYTSGSTNYGDYNDPTVNADIDKALRTANVSAAAKIWAAADDYVMTKDPAWIPLLYVALPQYIGTHVQNALYNGFLGYVDITNLWKTP